MKKVLVIGGGLSGLSAACFLAHNKFQVTLIESTHKLGGKTHSIIDKKSGVEIDNGQHIMLGCYYETFNFLKLLCAIKYVEIQNEFQIDYLLEGNRIVQLKAFELFYPINLLLGFIRFQLLSFKDKISLLKLLLKLKFIDSDSLSFNNVEDWLKKENQTTNSINLFWGVLCVGALNTSPKIASAKLFCEILKRIFWTGGNSFKIVLPKNSLNETFVNPAESFLLKHNAKIYKSERCEKILVSSGEVIGVKTNKRIFEDFDYYVIAVPFYSLKHFELSFINDLEIPYSPILNVYIWFKNNPVKAPFYSVHNSIIHWIFNKGEFINITLSNAFNLIDKSKNEIEKIILSELDKIIPESSKNCERILIIKEKRATFIPSAEVMEKRFKTRTELKNLFLAGEWTDTKLPSTIEGAIKSGRDAAEEIIFDSLNKE